MILTTPHGVQIDITPQIERLFLIDDYGDFRSQQNAAFIKRFCRKLVLAAGPHAPGHVISKIGPDLDPTFGQELATQWARIVEENIGK
jgi:hypothetical protein